MLKYFVRVRENEIIKIICLYKYYRNIKIDFIGRSKNIYHDTHYISRYITVQIVRYPDNDFNEYGCF
jgi:hypothetical protein